MEENLMEKELLLLEAEGWARETIVECMATKLVCVAIDGVESRAAN